MAAKWQQWIPFHIDRFMASLTVQAMHPAARWGYWCLITRPWQSEDCTVSADPLDLAAESSLGDELWSVHGARILRKFDLMENGRLRNQICYEEWEEARRIFERNHADPEEVSRKRSEAGRKGNLMRWGLSQTDRNSDGNHSQTDRKVSHTVQGQDSTRQNNTGTGTRTSLSAKVNGKDGFSSLGSIVSPSLIPPGPLPETKADMIVAGWQFSNVRDCGTCGELLEWWTSRTGKQAPVLAVSGELHLGNCAAALKGAK